MKNTHKRNSINNIELAEKLGYLVCSSHLPGMASRWSILCRDAGRPMIRVEILPKDKHCNIIMEYDPKIHARVAGRIWRMHCAAREHWEGPETWRFQSRHQGHIEILGVPAWHAETLAFRATEHFRDVINEETDKN